MVTVVCMSASPLEFEPPGFPATAAGALDIWFTLAQPVLLGLIGFWAIRSKGKWGVAALGLVVAVLPVGLSEAAEWLAPDEPFMGGRNASTSSSPVVHLGSVVGVDRGELPRCHGRPGGARRRWSAAEADRASAGAWRRRLLSWGSHCCRSCWPRRPRTPTARPDTPCRPAAAGPTSSTFRRGSR